MSIESNVLLDYHSGSCCKFDPILLGNLNVLTSIRYQGPNGLSKMLASIRLKSNPRTPKTSRTLKMT